MILEILESIRIHPEQNHTDHKKIEITSAIDINYDANNNNNNNANTQHNKYTYRINQALREGIIPAFLA